ncbi:MAG: hypothetical protein Q9182_005478 [Xanthomendoza sp. 2 TL-2023]
MFAKQCEIMEKYIDFLEILEQQTKQPGLVEAVNAMAAQTNIQTEAILTAVKHVKDTPNDLLQQLYTLHSELEAGWKFVGNRDSFQGLGYYNQSLRCFQFAE